jgi:hypothetical protein
LTFPGVAHRVDILGSRQAHEGNAHDDHACRFGQKWRDKMKVSD